MGIISVVVVSHQSREHLASCLLSIREAQQEVGGELDIVLVDSGSSDGGPEFVQQEFPGVRVICQDNIGFGAACNLGVRETGGERVLLLNPDASLCSGALAALVAGLEQEKQRALVAPQLFYPEGDRQFSWMPSTCVFGEALQKLRNPLERLAANHGLLPRILRALAGPGWYTGACLLLRRDAFEGIGGFDESFFLYFEDSDLCRRLVQAGWLLADVPLAKVLHTKGGSSNPNVSLAYRRSQWRYYAKHCSAWERTVLKTLLSRRLPRENWPWQE